MGVPFLKYKKFTQADFFLLFELELKAAGFIFQKYKTFFNPGIRKFHFRNIRKFSRTGFFCLSLACSGKKLKHQHFKIWSEKIAYSVKVTYGQLKGICLIIQYMMGKHTWTVSVEPMLNIQAISLLQPWKRIDQIML